MDEKQEFIKAAVLGEMYWGTSKGPTLSEKLKSKFRDFKQEMYQEEISHIDNLVNNIARMAGFGGWKEYVPSNSKELKAYKRQLTEQGRLADFNEKSKSGHSVFIDWYLNHPKQCCYCGVHESELSKYFNGSGQAEKACNRKRGPWLEVERLYTYPENKNIYNAENCALACYICNNAKSDFISAEDFKPIAQAIHWFWKNKGVEYLENFESNWKELEEKLEKLKNKK